MLGIHKKNRQDNDVHILPAIYINTWHKKNYLYEAFGDWRFIVRKSYLYRTKLLVKGKNIFIKKLFGYLLK